MVHSKPSIGFSFIASLLFSLLVIFFYWQRLGDGASLYVDEKILSTQEIVINRVYYDTGHGIREKDKTSQALFSNDEYAEFYLPVHIFWEHPLRFDPLGGAGTVHLKKIALSYAHGAVLVPVPIKKIGIGNDIETMRPLGDGGLELITTPDAEDPYIWVYPDRSLLTQPVLLGHITQCFLKIFSFCFFFMVLVRYLCPQGK